MAKPYRKAYKRDCICCGVSILERLKQAIYCENCAVYHRKKALSEAQKRYRENKK